MARTGAKAKAKGEKAVDVRGTEVGSLILEGLADLCEGLASGEPLEKRFTVRAYRPDLAPRPHPPEEVRRVRGLIGASQPLFASLLGVGVETVRSWEQGKRRPSPMACRFLAEIAVDPNRWRRRLEAAADG